MNRKKKLRLIQTSLLIFGSFVIFFTYFNKDKISKELIVSKEDQKKIENQLAKQEVDGDIFLILNTLDWT